MLQSGKMLRLAKITAIWNFLTRPEFIFFYSLLIFGLLLARNPFSQRTLIPNMEPFPDTFHYIVPARNLVLAGKFTISRGFGDLMPGVPLLYSFTLLPFYLINSDVRMFYFANVFFSFVSLYLFFLIIKKITANRLIIGFSLFLFTTNYFLYWYPQWAMAENLILPLFLVAIYLLFEKATVKNAVLAALVIVAFYATKYAAVSLSAAFFLFYSVKYRTEKKILAVFLAVFGIVSVLLLCYLQIFLKTNHFSSLLGVVRSLFLKSGVAAGRAGTAWFSGVYILHNLPLYLRALTGDSARFMWDFTPILPKWLAVMGIIGLIWKTFFGKFKLLFLALIFLLLGQILFISSFYSFDMRYVYPAIPILIIGITAFLTRLDKRFVYLFTCGFFLFYFATNAVRLKSQIMLNLKYAETPWSYISVLKLNDFFASKKTKDAKPMIISPLPPYFIDYYSNGNYDLLPLSEAQEFRSDRHLVWGPGDYSDLHKLYKSFLKDKKELYVATYGLGVESYLHSAFSDLKTDFILTEVDNGCWEQCKIYRMTVK